VVLTRSHQEAVARPVHGVVVCHPLLQLGSTRADDTDGPHRPAPVPSLRMTPTLCPNSSESGVGPAHSSAFSRELVNRVSESNEDQPHPAYRVELPLHEGSYKLGGRQVGFCVRFHRDRSADRCRSHRLRRSLSAWSLLFAGLCQRRPRRDPGTGPICLARILWNYRN